MLRIGLNFGSSEGLERGSFKAILCIRSLIKTVIRHQHRVRPEARGCCGAPLLVGVDKHCPSQILQSPYPSFRQTICVVSVYA